MTVSVESVRDFVLQIEKSLAARRLYAAASAPYRDANERALEKAKIAAGAEGFTLRFGANDVFLEKQSLLNRPKAEEAFFFPLFRDGLRELTFGPDVTLEDISALLGILELKEHQLGPADDMVNHLWRSDLKSIQHNAIDGIGDVEDDGSAKDDFRGLVTALNEKIRSPAPPESGQRYAFMLDADVKVAAQDFHYDATTLRRTFDENPTVLRLTEQQAADLRTELAASGDQSIAERFIEILLVIVRLPFRTIDPAKIGPILGQLIEGYWTAREFDRLIVLLTHIDVASEEAPSPKARQAMSEVVTHFLTDERLFAITGEAEKRSIPLPLFSRLWDLLPDARAWPLMMDTWIRVLDQDLRGALLVRMRKRLAQNPELLKSAFASPEPARVRAALALLDEKTEPHFAQQLIGLASHPEESIRLKGLGAASKYGGPSALEVLWKAMESDPSKSVRLFAFRSIAASKHPDLAPRLRNLVTGPQFSARPVWEREKYVRLLGTVGGPAAEPLFESWIPSKRWMWTAKDLEMLELALRGLGACGDSGYEKVRLMAESGGKPGEVARKVLDSLSRAEIGEQTSFMRPVPASGQK
jgi:hypothetical protein